MHKERICNKYKSMDQINTNNGIGPIKQYWKPNYELKCIFLSYLTYLLTYLQFSVIKWAKQRPGQSRIDVKSDEAIQI